jgi:hypothetical protein
MRVVSSHSSDLSSAARRSGVSSSAASAQKASPFAASWKS